MRRNQHRLPFEYEIDTRGPPVTSLGGLPIVAEALTRFGCDEAARQKLPYPTKRPFQADDLIRALVLTLVSGGEYLDDVERLRKDEALCELLNVLLPSSSSVRQFLYSFHDEAIEKLRPAEGAFIAPESARLKALGEVHRAVVHSIAARFRFNVATLDIDATIIESHKRSALPHYLHGRGYQPTFAYWKEADLVVHDEFRDGNVPAAMGIDAFVKTAFERLPAGLTQRFLRADNAAYREELFPWLLEQNIVFAIGAKMRDPLIDACAAVSEGAWVTIQERADTIVSAAELSWRPKYLEQKPVRYIGIRMQPRQLEFASNRETVFLAIVTSQMSMTPVEVARWYWEKAGTIEDVHDCIKNELGGGVLPCDRFGANAAWMRIVTLAYNILSALRRMGPETLHRARPKRLRFMLFNLPAVVVHHARRLIAQLRALPEFMAMLASTRRKVWVT